MKNPLHPLAVAASAAWLFVYLLDIRIPGDRPTHLLLLPALVLVTLPVVRAPMRATLVLALLLLANVAYQGLIGDFQARSALEVLALCYILSLRPLRTDHGRNVLLFTVLVFYAISFATFLGTVFAEPVRTLRLALYLSSERRLDGVVESGIDVTNADLMQGGLSFLLHLFGYQLAAGSSAFLAGAVVGRGRLRTLSLLAFSLSIPALLLAGQRSALLAVILVALLLALGAPARVRAGLGAGAVVVTLAAGLLFTDFGERRYNTVDRLTDGEGFFTRAALQGWALSQIPMYPFGLEGAGIDYELVAPIQGPNGALAPHNGYLTRTLNFGWPVLLLAIPIFVQAKRSIVSGFRVVRRRDLVCSERYMRSVVASALLGAMVNALFHNASLLTFQPDTVLFLFFAVAAGRLRSSAHDFRAKLTFA